MSNLKQQAVSAAKDGKVKDQTEQVAMFTYEPPAAGPTGARLVGYVELGKRNQKPYQGKAKSPCLEALVEFELLGAKHATTVGEGDKARVVYPIIREKVAVKMGETASFNKLLNKMAYGRSITHMAMMLEEPFLLTVEHNKVVKDGVTKTYANIRNKDSGWLVGAPVYNANPDPLTDPDFKPLAVQDQTASTRLLLWDAPTKEQWDSIFIDGTRTVTEEDGSTSEVSKNWIQNDIMQEAIDFEGSALQSLIVASNGLDLDGGKAEATAASAAAPEAETNTAPVTDPLAALGLTG